MLTVSLGGVIVMDDLFRAVCPTGSPKSLVGDNQLERERGKERKREGEIKKETKTGKERGDGETSIETARSVVGSRDTV